MTKSGFLIPYADILEMPIFRLPKVS